jgi:hypothetical protein
MKIIEGLKSLARALEDIEDPQQSELRRLRERVKILEAENAMRPADAKRAAR